MFHFRRHDRNANLNEYVFFCCNQQAELRDRNKALEEENRNLKAELEKYRIRNVVNSPMQQSRE